VTQRESCVPLWTDMEALISPRFAWPIYLLPGSRFVGYID
jgi:hypothetical protein